MKLTDTERGYLEDIDRKLGQLRGYLQTHPEPGVNTAPTAWLGHLTQIKSILGNTSNWMSLVAALLAREYLSGVLQMRPYDAAAKAQGACGLDVDEQTISGERVVAEIKTTEPYKENDLGAAQKASFRKDFKKLRDATAPHKFFFVTSERAFLVVQARYMGEVPGVTVVLLGEQPRAVKG